MGKAFEWMGGIVAAFGFFVVFSAVGPESGLGIWATLRAVAVGAALMAVGYYAFLWGEEKSLPKEKEDEGDEYYQVK